MNGPERAADGSEARLVIAPHAQGREDATAPHGQPESPPELQPGPNGPSRTVSASHSAIPAAAVEAAARAGWEADRLPGEPHWHDLQPHDADSHRTYARLLLEAALPHLTTALQNEPGE